MDLNRTTPFEAVLQAVVTCLEELPDMPVAVSDMTEREYAIFLSLGQAVGTLCFIRRLLEDETDRGREHDHGVDVAGNLNRWQEYLPDGDRVQAPHAVLTLMATVDRVCREAYKNGCRDTQKMVKAAE